MNLPVLIKNSCYKACYLVRYFICSMLLFVSPFLFSQSSDYFFHSSDNEVAMELSRSELGINIALLFFKASQFEYVLIEKSADAQNSFSQCKYIKFNESANDSVVIVKRDVYPLTSNEDVYYRVKTVTKEGVTRIYPPVRLPGLKEAKKN